MGDAPLNSKTHARDNPGHGFLFTIGDSSESHSTTFNQVNGMRDYQAVSMQKNVKAEKFNRIQHHCLKPTGKNFTNTWQLIVLLHTTQAAGEDVPKHWLDVNPCHFMYYVNPCHFMYYVNLCHFMYMYILMYTCTAVPHNQPCCSISCSKELRQDYNLPAY